jgi:hypothetical protein
VNAAMTGINSHVILPIARDCGREDGDIWVIYMGNNEVVGPFGSGTVFGRQTPNLYLIRGSLIVKGTRTGELLSQILAGSGGATAADSEWGGMAMFVNNQVSMTILVCRSFTIILNEISRISCSRPSSQSPAGCQHSG